MGASFIIAIIMLVAVFALALLVLGRNRSLAVNQTFAALVFFIGFWLTSSLFVDLSLDMVGVYFWSQVSIVWISNISAVWLYFTHIFPRKRKISIIRQSIMIIPPLIFLVLSPTNLNVISVKILNNGTREIFHGILYPLVYIYFIICAIWGIVKLLKKYEKTIGVTKIQIKYILIGTICSSTLATVITIISPTLQAETITNFSSLTILFFLVFSVYAILKHHLMEIRVMAAEVFTGLLILVLLVNVLTFQTKEQLILNFGLFFAAIIFGIFLIKSVIQESRARQEVEEMAKKLRKANVKLKKLDEVKSEFISIASHQLRTPLSAIKGYVSMILDGTYGNLDEEKREVLDRVYASNERLITLVNDLLNLSRIERGKLQFDFRSINNLGEILSSVIDEARVIASKKNLQIDYKEKPLPLVRADPHKLRQIFVNIIDNAIKYTEKGGLKISTEVTPRKITFIFKDTGLGMTRSEIHSIYEKFRRGSAGEKHHVGGIGIGLYICYKVIEAHGGKIYAKSKGKNKGTTFYVELPCKK